MEIHYKSKIIDKTYKKKQPIKTNICMLDKPFKKIVIAISDDCNLHCKNCNHLIGKDQAPISRHIDVKIVKKFVNESLKLNLSWKLIGIIGGEPTLNPHYSEIIQELSKLRRKSNIVVFSNGYGKFVKKRLKETPKWVRIRGKGRLGSKPHGTTKQRWTMICEAPIDVGTWNDQICTPCLLPWKCGISLTCDGYYLCRPGGAIDRVVNHGKCGISNLKEATSDNLSQMIVNSCKYCGGYHTQGTSRLPKWQRRKKIRTNKSRQSKFWKDMFAKYKLK